jgi:cell wall-associated NlpC family hydrolase
MLNNFKKFLNIICLLLLIISASNFGCTPANQKQTSLSGTLPGTKRHAVVKTAEKYMGVKYKFGGKDPSGFDCSGYSSYVYEKNGISIPHSAQQQYANGKRIGIKKAKPGDLVFFRITGWKISHVGIYLGDYKFIHAPSRGKSISVDDMRKDYWQKRYAGTVTYF